MCQVSSSLHCSTEDPHAEADELVRAKGKRLHVVLYSQVPNALELETSGFDFCCQ